MVNPLDYINRIILELRIKIQKKNIWNNYHFFLRLYHECRITRFVRLRYIHTVCISNYNLSIFIFLWIFQIDIFKNCSWLRLRFEQTNQLLETTLSGNDGTKMEKESKEDAIPKSNPNFRNRSRLNSWSFERFLLGSQIFPVNHVPNLKQESQSEEKIRLVQQIR